MAQVVKAAPNGRMTAQQKRDVWTKIEWEGGFGYFINGSSFPEIKAYAFRERHAELVTAWRNMEALLGPAPDEITDEDIPFGP